MRLKFLLSALLFINFVFSQNYHDTQGKLEITNSGQATYTLPIAMPPSLNNVGPIINLVYVSGQTGGIVGQGWSINSISAISRMATRKDIDRYIDGVDFDSDDKLALDGQRLILKTGTYWANGSTYQTEVQSNSKIQFVISGSLKYFVVTSPDGSRTWYGNYGGMNGTDLTSFYIVRFEDIKGNYITYHYENQFGLSFCIKEIRFSANTNGILPQNKIVFNYKQAGRIEKGYVGGNQYFRQAILDYVNVITASQIFRKYQLTHERDTLLGYDRLVKIQEYNGNLEAANPVLFEYSTTESTNVGSQQTKSYNNNIDFTEVSTTGDFDGDGRMDFVTDEGLFTKVFVEDTGNAPVNLSTLDKKKFSITTLNSGKLNQFNSLVSVNQTATTSNLKVYNLVGNSMVYSFNKTINLNNIFTSSVEINSSYLPGINIPSSSADLPLTECEKDDALNGLKDSTLYLEGDYNGDGISELLIVNSINEHHLQKKKEYYGNAYSFNMNTCEVTITSSSYESFLLDMNPSSSTVLGTSGLINLNTTLFNHDDKHYVMDFNGDGKSDILILKEDKSYKVISFKQLSVSPWVQMETIGEGIMGAYSKKKQILFGDYNGDAKADVMLPHTEGGQGSSHSLWHIYYSNPNPAGGSFFVDQTRDIVEYRPDSGTDYSTQIHLNSYYSLDVNKDGKSDLVRVWRKKYHVDWTINNYNTRWKVYTYINNIGNIANDTFTPDYVSPCIELTSPIVGEYLECANESGTPSLPMPIASPYKYGGLNNELLMINNHYDKLTYINFSKDVAKDVLLKKVTSSGGTIVDEIDYKSMEPTTSLNNGMGTLDDFYSSNNSVNYPYVELKKIPNSNLVLSLKNTVGGLSKTQEFKYHGYVVNLNGIGAVGFNKTARSAWFTNSSSKRIWSIYENNTTAWRGATQRSYSQLVTNGGNFTFVSSSSIVPTGIISSTVSNFINTTASSVYRLYLKNQKTTDYLTNVSNTVEYTYDTTYLLPTKVVSSNFIGTVLHGSTTVESWFENNPTGVGTSYYIGRPTRTTQSTSAYGTLNNSEEKFTYTNNKLTKTEKKGNTTDAIYITEEFEYNDVGNITKKILSVPGADPYVAPRTTEYTYDTSQRFVKTVKDVEGLISENLVFHPLYGLVMESKTPFGQITKNEYDNWGKRTKVTDYLNKSISYTYTKSGSNYTTTEVSQDGSSSVIIADALGRTIKKGKKNFDATWSYVSTEYDAFGRKFRESEPYFGTTPSLWNTSEFDDYSRVIKSIAPTGLATTITYTGLTITGTDGTKTTSSTKNANGHVVSASDNGGIINYTYYADGSLKTSNFDGTELYMEYDAYGRKTKLSDPSAGTYTYTYNAYGEILEETTPKGKTTYEYDNFGKITQKKVEGLTDADYTDITTNYVYHPTTKLLTTMNVINPNDGNSTYTYEYTTGDNRLKKTIETTPYASFSKELTFDEFGRDLTVLYQGTDLVSGKSTSKKVRNGYQNGTLNQISDDISSQVLWRANNVNERGQLTNGSYGNAISITNTYDQYGLPTQMKHDFFDETGSSVDPNGFLVDGSMINVMTLNTTLNSQRGNLTSRSTSLFNLTENFQYDSLDRLIEWGSEPELLHNLLFSIGFEGFTATTGAILSSAAGKLKITTSVANAGARKLILPNATVGTKLTISAYINKATTNKVKVSIVEQDPTSGLTVENELGLANEGTFQAEYEVSTYKDVYLKFAKAPTSTDVGTTTQFLVDNIVINRLRKYQQTYDNKGRIEQSPLGNYSYDDTKKYQNSKVKLTQAGIAYYNQHPLQEVSYNAFKSPIRIFEENHDKINFTYNTFQSRSSMFYGGMQEDKLLRSKRKHYAADGSIEIKTSGGAVEFITYIGSDAYNAPVIYKTDGGTTQEYLYLHRDYLGSIVAISNQAGTVVEKRHFDAWGSIAKVTDGSGNELAGLTLLDRGYTGHEHLQSVGLIHMNGRLYDAKVHRFLMPDNNIQDPSNTQNYNRYGYVLNNPLKYSDPSGETILAAVLIGALISAATYTLVAMNTGASFSMGGLFQSAITGAISGALTFGIGTGFESICGFTNTASGFWSGAGIGASTGFVTGVFSTTFNSLISGGSLKIGEIIKGGAIGAIIGGVIGGVRGGLKAQEGESNFWTGKKMLNTSKGVGAHSEAAKKIVAKGSIMGKYVGKHENVNVYESSELGNGATSGGMTLPPNRIIVGKGAYALKSITLGKYGTFDLFQHEFGHILQFRQPFVGYYGFYHVIGPESLLFSATSFSNNYWTETWANFLSSQHSGSLFFDKVRFPIQDISIFNKAKFYIDPLSYILP